MMPMQLAQLVLKTGERFDGFVPATQTGTYCGELVFNTGMNGYVESLTDPSYAGQILCFTYPLIGNYGVITTAWESNKIQVQGVVMSECAAVYSHHAANSSLRGWLEREQIPFIVGVDTRAVTKRLRVAGGVMGAITTASAPIDFPEQFTMDWMPQVSVATPQYYGEGHKTIIVVDCGLKENIIRCLRQFPLRIKRVPFNYDYTTEPYDGVVISNGPGDPILFGRTIAVLRRALTIRKPVLGICLGAQLMALATGAKTYKLHVGHRSQNQPCLYLPSGRCYLSSQNHGYAIDEQSLAPGWKVLFRNLNDATVAGIVHEMLPFFAVQFHPEAAPGPVDTQWLFEQFYHMVIDKGTCDVAS